MLAHLFGFFVVHVLSFKNGTLLTKPSILFCQFGKINVLCVADIRGSEV